MDLLNTLTARLKVLMEEHRIKAAPLARSAQLNESAVRDILRGRSKNPGIITLQKIAAVMRLRPSALFEAGEAWELRGRVDAFGKVIPRSLNDGEPTHIESPFFQLDRRDLAALMEEGGSLAPFAYPEDYIIYDPRMPHFRESDLGRPCVCLLEDDELVVMIPRLGDIAGRHHLTPVSGLGAPRLNVAVKRLARVLFVIPPALVPTHPKPTHAGSDAVHEEQTPFEGPSPRGVAEKPADQ